MIIDEVRSGESLNAESNQFKKQPIDFRKVKMLMILPLLLLPFITLAFWALGGGKGASDSGKMVESKEGLNLDLPSANIKDDSGDDKLTFYEKAQQMEEKNYDALQNDSILKLQSSVDDPNKLDEVVANSPSHYDPTLKKSYTGLNTSPVYSEKYGNATEDKIMQRLKQLQQEINKPQPNPLNTDEQLFDDSRNLNLGNDVDRLEGMMKMIQEKSDRDPEMEKLEGMLDKILDIQHPDRVKERLKEKSIQRKTNAFPVVSTDGTESNTFLTLDTNGIDRIVQNGFYGLNEQKREGNQNAVEAVVHETQTLVNGSNVKLRLINDIYVNGTFIPKGNFLFGMASLEGERLRIEINSIRYDNSIFPVKLAVYDLDGLAGINIPGAITRDVVKQSAENSLQNLELATLNPSLAAQATATGINAAKSLLSRKVKLVRVTVKAGYKVLLWNEGNEQ